MGSCYERSAKPGQKKRFWAKPGQLAPCPVQITIEHRQRQWRALGFGLKSVLNLGPHFMEFCRGEEVEEALLAIHIFDTFCSRLTKIGKMHGTHIGNFGKITRFQEDFQRYNGNIWLGHIFRWLLYQRMDFCSLFWSLIIVARCWK